MKRNTKIQVRLEDCFLDRVKEVAEKKSKSVTDVVIEGLWRFLRKYDASHVTSLEKAVSARAKYNKKRGGDHRSDAFHKNGGTKVKSKKEKKAKRGRPAKLDKPAKAVKEQTKKVKKMSGPALLR